MQNISSKYFKITLILLFSFTLSANLFAQIDEYAIKTSFIFKFAKYTEWPKSENENFIVAVIGKNPFKDSLDEIASRKKIKGLTIEIKYINSIYEIGNAHILFIPKSEKKLTNNILEITKNKSILLISEYSNAAEEGVHINFFLNNKKQVRFEINTKSLKESNLKISSLLLEVARLVK